MFQSPRLVLSASQQKAVSKPKRQLTEAKVRHKTKGSGSSGALSQSELALIAVDELRRSQNDALLRVLEEEQVLQIYIPFFALFISMVGKSVRPFSLFLFYFFVFFYNFFDNFISQRKEKEREAMLSAVAAADLNERSRLDRVFAGKVLAPALCQLSRSLISLLEVERARASDRIMRLTAEHEMALIQRMGQLGFD